MPPKSLLFHLLQRKHEEGRLTWAGLGAQQAREPPAFSLHEVSRVFRDFMHNACRGLYQAVSCERAAGGGRRRGRGCGLTPPSSRSRARSGSPRARRGCWT